MGTKFVNNVKLQRDSFGSLQVRLPDIHPFLKLSTQMLLICPTSRGARDGPRVSGALGTL